MSQRVRKFIGTLILIPFVLIYVIIAGAVGDMSFRGASPLLQAIYFVTAGFAWVIPAGLLIRWMQKPDA